MEVNNSKTQTPSSHLEAMQPRINRQDQSMFGEINKLNSGVIEEQLTGGTYKQKSLLKELQNVNQMIKDIDSKITRKQSYNY